MSSTGRHKMITDSGWNLGAFVLYTAINVLAVPAYVHFLGASHFGIFMLLNSILAPLGLLNFGFGQATVKYVAESMARGKTEEATKYISNTLLFNLGIGTLGALGLAASSSVIAHKLLKSESADVGLMISCLYWIAGSWLLTQVSATFISALTGLQEFKKVALWSTIAAIGSAVSGLVPLAFGGGLLAVIQARSLWALLAVLLWWALTQKAFPTNRFGFKYDAVAFRNSFAFGSWQTAANIGGILGGQADKYLLGAYVSPAAVALFSIPQLIYGTLYGVVAKLTEVLFPAISRHIGLGNEGRAVTLFLRAGGILSLLMVALQGSVYVFAHDVLRVYVGDSTALESAGVLRLMTIAAVISAPSIVVQQYLLGSGQTRWTAATSTVSGLLTFGFSLLLVPRWGLPGAAWGNLFSIIVSRPLMHGMIWRGSLRNQISAAGFFGALYGSSASGLAVVIAFGWLRDRFAWQPNLPSVVLLTSAAFVVVFLLSALIDRVLFGRKELLNLIVDLIRMYFPRIFRVSPVSN